MTYKQPKPIMRTISYTDFHSGIIAAVDKVIKNPSMQPYQNCLNCEHWHFGKDLCGLFNAKPPTDIIVYSCESYKDGNDIPF